MQISIILLGKLVNFFIMILLGFILVNKHILNASDSRILSIIVVYLVMPCAIINSFEIGFTKEKLQGLLFSAVLATIIHILLLIFINIGRKLWHWNTVECATVMYSNSGNMIIPLVNGFRLCTVFMCIYVCTADISLDTLQHHARRKATYGMEKDNNQYKCNSHNSRTPTLFLPDKTAICHTHTGKRHRKYACTSQHDSNWHADG